MGDLPEVLRQAAWWERAVETGAHVRSRRREFTAPDRVANKPFFALPNPFEPLLAIWRLGYCLGAIGAEAAVLIAPEVDAES
jgi:hypothetical protein